MTGIRRQKAQSEQAAALLAAGSESESLERQARAVSRMPEHLRVRAGRGVLGKQAEHWHAVELEDTADRDRTAERELEWE